MSFSLFEGRGGEVRLRWKFHPFWVCCIEAIGSGRPVSLSLCEIDVSLGLDQRFGTYGKGFVWFGDLCGGVRGSACVAGQWLTPLEAQVRLLFRVTM